MLWWKTFNKNVYKATTYTVEKKHNVFEKEGLKKFEKLCVEKRKKSLEHSDKLWEKAKEGFTKNRIKVFFAENGEDAKNFIARQIGENKLIVKGKSLTTEEIELRQFLECKGHEVVETDLGEWIIQQRNELPSHFTAPAVHLNAKQVAKLIEKKFGKKLIPKAEKLTAFIRKHLREKFLKADIGIIGANFIIAQPSTIVCVSNEGNISLSSRLPRVVFVVTGYDRIYDNEKNMEILQKLLTSSATGQYYTSYIDFIRKPLPHQKIFLIVLDNGRKRLIQSEFKDAARCIRCASCLNICPVYKEVGGHKFGKVYHGGIGSLLTHFTGSEKDASKIADLCLRCGSCEPECPMHIPISKLVASLSENYPLPFYLNIPLKLLSPTKKEPKKENPNLIFIGCAFRTPFMKKVNEKIKNFAPKLNADICESGCCGMPHFYKGKIEESEERVNALKKIFADYKNIFVPCSSGFSFLSEIFGEKIKLMSVEISKLSETGNKSPVFYHIPCHLKHKNEINEKKTLSEKLNIIEWEHWDKCCGSAGTFWLNHPLISKKILSRKKERAGNYSVITSCPSCYFQLKRIFGNKVKHTLEMFQ